MPAEQGAGKISPAASAAGRDERPAWLPWLARPWAVAQAASLACTLEAAAPKAGNVHPTHDFSDMTFVDFAVSGAAIGEVIAQAATESVGELIHATVAATRQRVRVNTNLGTVLLVVPLVQARLRLDREPSLGSLRAAVAVVLESLTAEDADRIYAAIRLAQPGGLGRTGEHDVHAEPPADIRLAMQQVADRDAVARQYVTGFEDIGQQLVPALADFIEQTGDMREALCGLQVHWMARDLDGLILRKAGRAVAEEARRLAHAALRDFPQHGRHTASWQALDDYLRADGHRRNPGTTADLIAATIFWLLVEPPERTLPAGRYPAPGLPVG
jgi:triphosphoribosyl-dephospho-CoA synthase